MSKKYSVIVERVDGAFTARVVRRRTSKGTTIEREQAGFSDQLSAKAWGEAALTQYLARRAQRAENRRARRNRQRERDAWLDAQPLQKLVELADAKDKRALDLLRYKADLLWQEIGFRALKRGESEDTAVALANKVVGRNWTQRLAKAASGDLDHVKSAVHDMAVANAVRLALVAHEAAQIPPDNSAA
jgi:hypothetical protein